MRKAVIVLALAVLPLFASAQAGMRARLTLWVSSYKVLYGHQLVLAGRLVPGLADVSVRLESWRYGSSSPRLIATVTTRAGGHWSARVRPAFETIYRARAGAIISPRRTVGVRPLLALRELGDGGVWARVSGGRAFAGRTVQLQRSSPSGWQTIARKKLSSASIAVFALPLPASTLRVALSVNQAGAGYLGSTSHALAYRPYALTLTPSAYKVLFGYKLTLSGPLVNGHAGARIMILAWRFGQSAPRLLATVTTGARGMWSARVRPTLRTSYQAHWGRARASARVAIGVRPLLRLRELGNGRLAAHVNAARSFARKLVQLQQLTSGGAWNTLAKQPLNHSSSTVFALPLAAGSTLRVAISVNQAGAGYLGATSHGLAYRPL
jgi:hypothetical protein